MQLFNVLYLALKLYITCFGRPLRPSSGTLLTVVTAAGFYRELGWNKSCNGCQRRYAL